MNEINIYPDYKGGAPNFIPMFMYQLFPTDKRLLKAVSPMFSGDVDEIAVEVTGAVFLHVKLETKMPRLTSEEELKSYTAPTWILAGEKDIFFSSRKNNPASKRDNP